MSGAPTSPSAVQEDARAALQALLASSKSPKSKTNGSSGQEIKDQAGQALRQLFRTDFLQALRPSKADATQAEIEAKLSRLVDKASKGKTTDSSFKPPARVPATKPKSAGKKRLTPEDILATMEPEKLPEPLPRMLRRPLTLEEEMGSTAGLRVKLRENRKALLAQDRKVTELTAKLKKCRKDVWDQRREQNSAELKVMRILKEHASKLPAEMQKELADNEEEETRLAEELSEARANVQHWVSIAKRQDGMLQQEREAQKGGDAMSILAKHPAGEVFFPPMSPDSDSEDDHMRRPRRGREDVSLGSDSEDDEDYASTVASAAATLQRSRQLGRQAIESDDDDAGSVGSSVVSPSGESNSGNFMDKASESGSLASSPAGGAPKAPAAGSRKLPKDDSTSEEEVETVVKETSSAAARQQEDKDLEKDLEDFDLFEGAGKAKAAKAEQARPVPPLPGISGGRQQLPEDEAEEVSSEEIMETSRSV